MTRVIIGTFFFCLILFISSSCTESLYPIYNKLKEERPFTVIYESDYDPKNFFQLRIHRTSNFLPVYYENNAAKTSLISDFPIKRYQQARTAQNQNVDSDTTIVEETYLYLDKYSMVKTKNTGYGYAYYFVTYPILERNPKDFESRTEKYFNNPDTLFTNITRQIKVGFWLRNSKNELLLILQNSKKDLATFLGKSENSKVTIEKISHPSRLNRRLINLNLFQIFGNSKYSERIIKNDLNKWFKSIESEVAFIDLKSVLNIDDNDSGLMFFNIPKSKKFSMTRNIKNKKETYNVSGFSIGYYGKNKFYLRLRGSNEEEKYFLFKERNVLFLNNTVYGDTIKYLKSPDLF